MKAVIVEIEKHLDKNTVLVGIGVVEHIRVARGMLQEHQGQFVVVPEALDGNVAVFGTRRIWVSNDRIVEIKTRRVRR